jgi:hypothetical protein
MGNHRWLKIECLYVVGDPGSEQLKVSALNLYHPTASPLFCEAESPYYDKVSLGRKAEGEGVTVPWNPL